MQIFWEKGYEATSIEDLLARMKIQRGSLYDTFKDKRSLFKEAILLYRQEIVAKRIEAIDSAPTGVAGIERFFSILIDHLITNRKTPGCLNTNTAAELGGTDPEFSRMIGEGMVRWEETFLRVLKRARKDGSLKNLGDLRPLAKLLICLVQGLNIVGKVYPDREHLEATVRAGLSILR
jgi:TetR/AcrR family transcriptional repressor of nem operon